MIQLRNSLLATACIAGLVGIVYFAIPGFSLGIAVCIALFLSAFAIAVMVSPSKAAVCPQCGALIERGERGRKG